MPDALELSDCLTDDACPDIPDAISHMLELFG
jgi:hypothetical protein